MSQFFSSGGKSIRVSASASVLQWIFRMISFRIDWLDLLAIQGTLKHLLQHHSSKGSILQSSAFFVVQLSHPYITTVETISLTRWTFVGKVRSLLFNMLSRSATQKHGQEELPHAWGQGRQPGGATPPPRSSSCGGHRRAERSYPRSRSGGVAVRRYPSSKVRSSSCVLLEQPWRDTPRPRRETQVRQ